MKRLLCKRISYLFVIIIVYCICTVSAAIGDTGNRDNAKTQIFGTADKALKEAQLQKAELFSPEAYEEAMDYYNDAEEAYTKKKDIAGIEKKLNRAVEYFNKAAETSSHASEFFQKAKKAMDDAANVDSVKYEYDLWKDADNMFRKAIIQYEKGDLDDAREDAKEAEDLFRKAELETIKTSYLDAVRKEIEKMEDLGKKNNAPKIFDKAKKLVKKAVDELERQRYSNDNARSLVAQAGYEMKHAVYVNNYVRKLKDADYTFEDVILEGEKSFTRICAELGIDPKFDKGYGDVDKNVIESISKLKSKNSKQENHITTLEAKIKELEIQITKMMNDEEELKRQRQLAEQALKRQKQIQIQHEKKIQSIRSAFSHNEGKVLMDGNNVVIRLYGLNFPSGKSVIEPKYFGLLSKVRKSFSLFKNCAVVIEGHTDSVGSDAVNQKLSEARAEAVMEYILANSSIPKSRINAIGYGETKPVASNETTAGQAKNRRIDVVIIPSSQE